MKTGGSDGEGADRDFMTRIRAHLLADPPPFEAAGDPLAIGGDHVLAPGLITADIAATARHAAVLVPIIAHPGAPTLLLTLRAGHLPTHAGQIAFPGGRVEASDRSPLETALREAREEIGLEAGFVQPLGFLDAYLSGTGFRIVPVVAQVKPGFTLRPDPSEVDEVFEVPLDFLMSPANHQRHRRELRGMLREFYAMPFGDRFIWGVTAGIIRRLWERMQD